ncbi:MAG: hypothetical protein ABSF35_07395 [Polyangia bacterium]|jgi:hypothetical protein
MKKGWLDRTTVLVVLLCQRTRASHAAGDGRDDSMADRFDFSAGFDRADVLSLVVLWATAAVVAAPLLFGGWATYLDNPIHIAEIKDLSRAEFNGWSDIGQCGLPLGSLHSPLWYGLLAWLYRYGVPLRLLYSGMLVCAFAAPASAVYLVARRRLGPFPSCALAYLLLVQFPASTGIASALGGMSSFYLATAALVLLLDALARRERHPGIALRIAALTAVVGLSHSFFFAILAVVALLHGAQSLVHKQLGRCLRWDVPALAMGVGGAAVYWLPLVLMRHWLVPTSSNLPARSVLALLLFPIDVLELRIHSAFSAAVSLQTVPMILLAVAGVAGTLACVLRPEHREDNQVLAVLLGWLILLLLTLVVSGTNATWLGPLSWRLLYLTRVGFALAGIALLAERAWAPARLRPKTAGLLGVLAISMGACWGQPVARMTPLPADPAMRDADHLWAWLRANREATWGRVLIQDTFWSVDQSSPLFWSHLLARTSDEAGVQQVGPYYSALPFPTNAWARSEFSRLLGVVVTDADSLRLLKVRMAAADATHAVFSTPWAESQVNDDPEFTFLHRVGPFSVYQFRAGRSRPALPLNGILATAARDGSGHIRVETNGRQGGTVVLAESYHPFWTVQGAKDVELDMLDVGLMRLRVPSGRHQIRLDYLPPHLPAVLSAAVGIVLGLAWLWLRLRRVLVARRRVGT